MMKYIILILPLFILALFILYRFYCLYKDKNGNYKLNKHIQGNELNSKIGIVSVAHSNASKSVKESIEKVNNILETKGRVQKEAIKSFYETLNK